MSDVRKIGTNARHRLGLVNDMLDLSNIESGKLEAYVTTFGIGLVVLEVAATMKTLVEKNSNILVIRLEDGLGEMHPDMRRIRQMLPNLLSNAAQFTEEGTITALAERHGTDWMRFVMSGTGFRMMAE